LGEERDLHLGRPRVSIVDAILLNEGFLLFDGQRHGASNRHAPGSPSSTRTGSKRLVLLLITTDGTTGTPLSKVNLRPAACGPSPRPRGSAGGGRRHRGPSAPRDPGR